MLVEPFIACNVRRFGRAPSLAAMAAITCLVMGCCMQAASGESPESAALPIDFEFQDASFPDTAIEEEVATRPACCSAPDGCDHCRRPLLAFRDRLTVGAEYLLLRPSFSNSTALYRTTTSGGTELSQVALDYSFGYSSGVRGFLGYRLTDDWMVRFSYLTIGASDGAGGVASGNWVGGEGTGFLGPYDTIATVAGQSIESEITAALDVYDLEIAGRLPTTTWGVAGSPSLWEAAAAVGIRFADVGIDSNVFNDQTALGQLNQVFVTTSREFHGVGPRLAIQGRRYLGKRRAWSVFASGAAALLVGTLDNTDTRLRRRDEGGGVITTNYQSQSEGGTLVVPNLDLSLGASWQLGQRTSLSAGWLLMYWGEVGYSERISTARANVFQPDLVPLTNSSLSYDGAFFRLTHNF